MRQIRAILLFFILGLGWIGPVPAAWAEPVRVWAAASLRDVLQAAAEASGQEVLISVAGSNTVARQLAAGAPADLVILANSMWMDWLVGQGVVRPEQVGVVAGNHLVLAGRRGSAAVVTPDAATLTARLGDGRLAVGMVESVPAGIYARTWMERAGIWDALAPHLAETETVTAALALLSRGEVPLAIVYASDLHGLTDVVVLYDIPPDVKDPITYPMARLTPKATAFAEFLMSSAGQALFTSYGFAPAPVPR